MPERRVTPNDIAEDVRRLVEQTRASVKGKFLGGSGAVGGDGGAGGEFINPLTGLGQLIVGGVAGALKKLVHPGVAGKVLTTTLTDVSWDDAAVSDVTSVNGQTGTVVLVSDDISDTGQTHKFVTAANLTKLSGIETGADVTDAANVAAAGAVMESDTTTVSMNFVIDEDSFASDLDTKIPTQQSVKAYVDAQISGVSAHAPVTILDSTNIDLGLTGQQITADLTTAAKTTGISYVIDGGGSVITAGIKGDIKIEFACTIMAWEALGDQTGSGVFDIWGDSYANFPPVVGDSICGAEKPTISSALKGQDTSLNGGAGWAISAGTILRFYAEATPTSLTRVTIALKVVRT